MTPPPDAASLHEAALAHLARYAATKAGLLRVLRRRVQRWAARARADGMEPEAIADATDASVAHVSAVVRRLAETGVVDDAAFAAARAARLIRSGRSRRVIAAHLAARGVDNETAAAALDADAADEWTAALLFARRRRLGPFRPAPDPDAEPDPARRMADLAAFARGGFPGQLALKVLALDPDEARDAAAQARRD